MGDNINQSLEQAGIRFSVVIPVYNAASTIALAIESCLAQSYSPFEIIVVNDRSTDNTENIILEKYGEAIKYKKLSQNMGSSVARNNGMDMATGDYIAFLDADDMWHKDKLQMANIILNTKPDIDLLYHPFTTENIINKRLPENTVLYRLPFVKLLLTNIIGTPCVVMKNSKDFRFEPSMRYMEDYDLWLRIGYKHKLYFINLPLTQLGRPILSKGGLSANRWKMRKGEMRAYVRLLKLNPLFVFLLPFLIISSLLRYLGKLFQRKA
ncbi:MAG TPA: glycosyltransferase family A protein [Flavipsychrobacter sp.]|nr:glycosyltransferase family A protein [Flavipsychrobacter sp.]